MRVLAWIAAALALAGCMPVYDTAVPIPVEVAAPVAGGALPPAVAAQNFVAAVDRVQPVAEGYCRARTRGVPCAFRIVIDDRPGQPPNAFQTLDRAGRPILGFTPSLIARTRNIDEIAFVVGHEAAHHILGHIPQVEASATEGALMAGVLAALGGADAAAVRTAQDIGATLGARRYSKAFELQADALGAEIALRAGFDPLRGAAFFDRLPDPGDRFLGTHPPNAERREVVRRTVAGLR
jgi:Zn-dependent protease with chaperone function